MQVLPLLVAAAPTGVAQHVEFDLTEFDFRHPNLIQAYFYASYAGTGNWNVRVEYRAMIDENSDPAAYPILQPRDEAHGDLQLADNASGGPLARVSHLLSLHPKIQVRWQQTGGVAGPQPLLYASLVVFSHRSA